MIRTTKDFTWDRAARILSAEASTLGIRPGEEMPTKLELRSPDTGATGHFYPVRTVKNDEGDVEFWIYSSVGLPRRTTIHLFND